MKRLRRGNIKMKLRKIKICNLKYEELNDVFVLPKMDKIGKWKKRAYDKRTIGERVEKAFMDGQDELIYNLDDCVTIKIMKGGNTELEYWINQRDSIRDGIETLNIIDFTVLLYQLYPKGNIELDGFNEEEKKFIDKKRIIVKLTNAKVR